MKVSIVLLNYGYHDFLFQSLRAIERMQKRECCELIFVDNGSSDNEWRHLSSRLSEENHQIDRCIRLDSNKGFAMGMNAGAEVAQGDWIVMLNSDTLVGSRFLEQILTTQMNANTETVGFLALPVYDWKYSETESIMTKHSQGDVVALTTYISCMPVRYSEIDARFILGPHGSVVVISAKLVRALRERYGCVYDPHFFMYGEDVDLFLRAKRLGFGTVFVPGNAEDGEAVWHIGSATSGGPSAAMRTLDKDPAVVHRILSGIYDNVMSHAGWTELVPLILIQCFFRVGFYFRYGLNKSPATLWRLLRIRRESRPRAVARNHSRPLGLWLSTYIALGRRAPMPWARRRAF